MTYQIYKDLAELNELSHKDAEAAFLDCCGSSEWARKMADARPFPMLDRLFETAEETWFSLSSVDHLEAFAAHPQIGASRAAAPQGERSAGWSAGEQAGVGASDDDARRELAEVNRLYHQRFGFIFIVCATGKTAHEILAIARARLGNSLETELKLAAEEQNRITQIRLGKLLEK